MAVTHEQANINFFASRVFNMYYTEFQCSVFLKMAHGDKHRVAIIECITICLAAVCMFCVGKSSTIVVKGMIL